MFGHKLYTGMALKNVEHAYNIYSIYNTFVLLCEWRVWKYIIIIYTLCRSYLLIQWIYKIRCGDVAMLQDTRDTLSLSVWRQRDMLLHHNLKGPHSRNIRMDLMFGFNALLVFLRSNSALYLHVKVFASFSSVICLFLSFFIYIDYLHLHLILSVCVVFLVYYKYRVSFCFWMCELRAELRVALF